MINVDIKDPTNGLTKMYITTLFIGHNRDIRRTDRSLRMPSGTSARC
jgi:hypothetical protein